jgi:hypothetical protein
VASRMPAGHRHRAQETDLHDPLFIGLVGSSVLRSLEFSVGIAGRCGGRGAGRVSLDAERDSGGRGCAGPLQPVIGGRSVRDMELAAQRSGRRPARTATRPARATVSARAFS